MRAISKNTRKATAITLAAALVIAVYLNWQYARTGVTLEEDAVNVSAVSQETVPVTDELMTEAEGGFQCQQELWRSSACERCKQQRLQVL